MTSATVQLLQKIQEGDNYVWYPVGATVNPDINGYYTITGVPAGADYGIDVSLSGYGLGFLPFNVTGNVTGKNLILLKMVATPTASPAAGEVASGTTITLTTATAGATIYYTTDGGYPNTQYSSPIPITTDVTIEAYAVKDGMAGSELLRAAYTIPDAPFTGTAPGLYIGSAAIPEANTATLTQALGWLRGNAASNTKYTILIDADTSLPPTTLGGDSSGPTVVANGKTGVKITLRGKDAERRIQLSENGSLFRLINRKCG
ncbi:hypothetical protein FACS189442_1350 [Spirochaetia bacterium]|nr:hypothetical protein FACS189442_1350 [Spirochaetia bacterium]